MVVEKNVQITERFFNNRFISQPSWKYKMRLSSNSNSDENAHTHFLDVSDPLLYCFNSGVDYQIEACFTIHNVFCVFCGQKLKHQHQIPICICIFGHWILDLFFPVYPG